MVLSRAAPPDAAGEWLSRAGGRLLVAPSFAATAAALGWDRLDRVCAPAGGEEVRATPDRRTSRHRHGVLTCYRKVHHRGWGRLGWRDRLRRLGGPPCGPARTEFLWNRRLARLGIPVTRPVLLAEAGGGRAPSALVTLGVEGARGLIDLPAGAAGPVLPSAAGLAAALHRAGLVHRDLYLDHFLLGADGRLRLADLQRVIRPRFGFERWRVKDLAALCHSSPAWCGPRLRLRFFLHYCRLAGLPGGRRRRLLARVERKARRIAAHRPRWG